MEESSIKVSKLKGQLLKLDSLLLAVSADISETVLHCCYGDFLPCAFDNGLQHHCVHRICLVIGTYSPLLS